VHWYGADFATAPAVAQLKSYLKAIYARYHRPLWLTEFALANFGAGPHFPAAARQAAFITAATTMLQHLRYVLRYAWFALPASASDGTTGLFRAGPSPRPQAGRSRLSAPGTDRTRPDRTCLTRPTLTLTRLPLTSAGSPAAGPPR